MFFKLEIVFELDCNSKGGYSFDIICGMNPIVFDNAQLIFETL